MKSKLIELTDGSKLEVKVNFYTLYLAKMNGIDKKIDGKSELTDDENMELAGKLIYIILRSNGLKVDEEEAMMLTPMDASSIRLMMRADGNISMTMQLLRCHHSMANSCSVLKIKKKEIQE